MTEYLARVGVDVICVLIALVVFFLIIPPKWDPAIRLKEWTEKRRKL